MIFDIEKLYTRISPQIFRKQNSNHEVCSLMKEKLVKLTTEIVYKSLMKKFYFMNINNQIKICKVVFQKKAKDMCVGFY